MPRTASKEYTMPIKTLSEANRREHWAAKAKRVAAQRQTASVFANSNISELPLPLFVAMIRIAPKHRWLDDDNLRSSLKAVRDGIADSLKIDDRDPRVVWDYGQEVGKQYAVRVVAINSPAKG